MAQINPALQWLIIKEPHTYQKFSRECPCRDRIQINVLFPDIKDIVDQLCIPKPYALGHLVSKTTFNILGLNMAASFYPRTKLGSKFLVCLVGQKWVTMFCPRTLLGTRQSKFSEFLTDEFESVPQNEVQEEASPG